MQTSFPKAPAALAALLALGGCETYSTSDAAPRKQTASARHRDACGRERISERIRSASLGVSGV